MDIRSSLKVPTAPSRQNRIVAPEILRLLWPKITSEHDPRYTCHKNGAVPPPIMVQWTWPMLCNQVARQRPSTHVLHLPTGILLVGCLCPNMYPKHTHVALSHQEAWWNMLVLDETWLQNLVDTWLQKSYEKYQHFVQYMQAATRTNQPARFSDMCYIIRQTTWHNRMKPLMLNPDSQPNRHMFISNTSFSNITWSRDNHKFNSCLCPSERLEEPSCMAAS